MRQRNDVKDESCESGLLKHVLIMAGGTGGHVFPGLAVARYLKEKGVRVSWMGTSSGLESHLVPEEVIPLYTIEVKGLRGKGLVPLLLAPFKVMCAIMQARRIIRQLKPDVVLGMGGFASGPGGIAAFLSGCPLVVHEQNAKAGLTNKVLSYFAKYVLTGFPGAFSDHGKVIVVGNPARKEIETATPPKQRFQRQSAGLRLLVLGGSLGAKAINEMLPEALIAIPQESRLEVWHQTGVRHFDAVSEAYKSLGMDVRVSPFIKDMAEAYQWADVVICRAGALTVAELCAVGLGAVFIPFPHAVDDHQTANASFMVKNSAAICVQQADLSPDGLADLIKMFIDQPDKWKQMAQAAYDLRKIDVPRQIFAILGKANC